ncbi:hypothetical protein LTR53_008763, partial [Teratosphaeriaceae sp. CCFEE 6253]
MYRSALRAQPWTTSSGYVCHHCRHRLRQQTAATTQTRHASDQSQTAADADDGAGGGEDFLDFFNSLGNEVPPPVRDPPKKAPSPEAVHSKRLALKERFGDAYVESDALDSLLAHAVRKARDGKGSLPKGLGGESDTPEEVLKTKLRTERAVEQLLAARRRLKTSPNKSQLQRAKVNAAKARAAQQDRAQREEHPFDAVLEATVPPGGVTAVDGLLKDLEWKTTATSGGGSPSGAAPEPAAMPREPAGVAGLLTMLEERRADSAGVAEEVTASTEAMTAADSSGLATSSAQARIEKPQFRARTLEYPFEMAGAQGPTALFHRAISSDGSNVPIRAHPSTPRATEPTVSFSSPSKPMSLADKIREATSRPTWGGVAAALLPVSISKAKASFDSLRDADKVSTRPVVRTAGERTAWGGEAVPRGEGMGTEAADAGFASSGGELAETEVEDVEQAWARAVETNTSGSPDAVEPAEVGPPRIRWQEFGPPVLRRSLSDGNAGAADGPDTVPNGSRRTADAESPAAEQLENVAQPARLSRKKRAAAHAAARAAARASGAIRDEPAVSSGDAVAATDDAADRLATLHERHETRSAVGDDRHMTLAEAMTGPRDSDEAVGMEVTPVPALEADETPLDSADIRSLAADALEVTALDIPHQPTVPPLQYGLDRVLFNPGVYQMQDPLSRTYNFDPYLQKIMPVAEFDFNALKEYKTSSADAYLGQLANEHGKKFVGSTSSMTGTLGHFHYLVSNWRELNLNMLSRAFDEKLSTFTMINRAPNAIFLRYNAATGTYAIDADKEFDSPNVLMMLGKSMEKLLTLPREQYERYRRGNTIDPITPEEKDEPEAFQYTTMGDFLMRSQLDAHDPRLRGTGMFDLKTRAVLPIRMNMEGYEEMLGYEILTAQG